MRCVVDASVACKWLRWEESSELARRLLQEEHQLHAPRFLALELSNALWNKAGKGAFDFARASALAESIPDMGVQWEDEHPFCPAAVRLGLELEHPVYDCFYFVLAEHLGIRMVTEDRGFLRALKKRGRDGVAVRLRDIEQELGAPSAPH